MENFWHKQEPQKPLFDDVLWNLPENQQGRGKLVIIGGNAHKFIAPATAKAAAEEAGAGRCKVLMPDAVAKVLGKAGREIAEYAPSNRSGSFAKNSLGEMLDLSQWGDGVLLAGDFGHNSETAIALESLIDKYPGQITLCEDAIDAFVERPGKLLDRPQTLLVASFAQLQKISSKLKPPHGAELALKHSLPLPSIVEILHQISERNSAYLITWHSGKILLAVSGQVVTMPADSEGWRVRQAAWSSSFWVQKPANNLKTLATSLLQTR